MSSGNYWHLFEGGGVQAYHFWRPYIVSECQQPPTLRFLFCAIFRGNRAIILLPVYYIHYGPSMMAQGKTPWKDPHVGFTGVWGAFQVKNDLERPLKSPPGAKGSFPGTSLTVHSVPYKTNKLNWTSQLKVAYSAFFHKCTAQDNIEDLKYGSFLHQIEEMMLKKRR